MLTILRKSLPKHLQSLSRKQKVFVSIDLSVSLDGGYWDGGSRQEYYSLDVHYGTRGALYYPTSPPQFGGGAVPTIVLGEYPGKIIVAHGTFCGKEATPHLHVHPNDICELLGIEGAIAVPLLASASDCHVLADWLEERSPNHVHLGEIIRMLRRFS